jgi:hypothetical protein
MYGKPMSEEMMQKEEEKQKKRDEKHTAAALAVRKKFASKICAQTKKVRAAMKELIAIERDIRDEDCSLKDAGDHIIADVLSYGNGFAISDMRDELKDIVYASSRQADVDSSNSEEEEDEEEDFHDSSRQARVYASDREEKEDDGFD